MNGGIEGGRHGGMNGEVEGWKDRGRGGGMEGEMEKWRERWRDGGMEGGMEGWKEGWMKGWMARQMFAVALSPPGRWQAGDPGADPSHPGSPLRPCRQLPGHSGDSLSSSSTPGCCGHPGKGAAPQVPVGFTHPGHSWWWHLQLVDAPSLPPPPISHFPHPVPPVRGPSFTTAAQTGGNWLGGMFNPVSSAFPSHSSTPAAGPARPAAPAGPWGG